MTSSQRQDFGYSRTVSYTNRNHLSVITQKWGSVNKKVAPFCLSNVAFSVLLVWLLEHHGIDLSISEFGHEFMGVLVSFLVINKLLFTLGLYYELQGHVSKMNQSAIELTQLACSFTLGYQQDEYKHWRSNVCLQVLILLKATVLVIYKEGQANAWEIPELSDNPLHLRMGDQEPWMKESKINTNRRVSIPKQLYMWGYDLKSDRNLRTPIRIAHRLRDVIMEHKTLSVDPLDTIQERTLFDLVRQFMDSYYGVRKYLTCPLPFPLVQLGRIFVIFYVFTLPFALLSSELNLKYVQMILLTFLMTYGFMGIELLFVEINDPWAEDPNDLPLLEETRSAGEDIFLNLLHADGQEAVGRLWDKFSPAEGSFLDPYTDQVEKARGFLSGAGGWISAKETDPLL